MTSPVEKTSRESSDSPQLELTNNYADSPSKRRKPSPIDTPGLATKIHDIKLTNGINTPITPNQPNHGTHVSIFTFCQQFLEYLELFVNNWIWCLFYCIFFNSEEAFIHRKYVLDF